MAAQQVPGENIKGWEVTQSVKCLPCQHDDLSLIPRTHLKKYRAWWPVLVIPVMGRQRQEDHRSSLVSSRPMKNPVSKEVDSVSEDPAKVDL